MPPRIPISAIAIVALLAFVVARAPARGQEVAPPSNAPPGEPITLRPAIPDLERRARLARWWRRFETARPALSRATVRLREAHTRWREGATREPCHAARRALAEVDAAALQRDVDYEVVVDIGRGLDELDRASAACLERRYFEFDYRLRVGEAALAAARRRAENALVRVPE